MRLDFETFVISGPSTGSDTDAVDGACKNGVFTSPSPATCSLASQCLTDSFSITNPGGSAPPTICGTNTGKHSMRSCLHLCFRQNYNSSLLFFIGIVWIFFLQFQCMLILLNHVMIWHSFWVLQLLTLHWQLEVGQSE